MGGDTEEHVFEILERRHVDESAALDERIEQRGATRALETAREQPVLAADRDASELVFRAGMPPAGLCRVRLQGRRPHRESECVSLRRAA
jgi:hypothetical protein